jgi:hypothetical protein
MNIPSEQFCTIVARPSLSIHNESRVYLLTIVNCINEVCDCMAACYGCRVMRRMRQMITNSAFGAVPS